MRPPLPIHFHRYVALGDSSTQGIDDPDGAGGYRGWSERLAYKIAAAQGGLQYANFAARGLTTHEVRTRQLAAALALKPDLATLFCGTNDVTGWNFDAEKVAADIEHMQRELVHAGATVLSFTLPDLTPLMPLARLIAPRIAALNRALIKSSQNTHSILIDFAAHPIATDGRLWSDDRIHANSDGHARIADALAQALRLPESGDLWKQPLPKHAKQSKREWLAAEVAWIGRHLLPWAWDGLVGGSSALQRNPKQPHFVQL